MTVSYNDRITESGFWTFAKILSIWKGSMYKLLWKEMLIFVTLFYSLNLTYRYLLDEKQKLLFERVTMYCDAFVDLIPLSFVLGFFVSIVVARWWSQFESIPWPDDAAIAIGSMVVGTDDDSRIIRRTLIRYLNLMSVLVYRSISYPIKMRFPTLRHLVDGGLMTDMELDKFQDVPLNNSKWWTPSVWYTILLTQTFERGLLREERNYKELFQHGLHIRRLCHNLILYDWVNIPLVYTQVVTLASYTFFLTSLFGRQLLDPSKKYPRHEEIYFPIFTFLQFFFYMGWFKVAEGLLNPFGKDRDDFNLNTIIDRNFKVSYLAVDYMQNDPPPPQKDLYWDEPDPKIPYTESSEKFNRAPWLGSTTYMTLRREDMQVARKSLATIFSRHHDESKPSSSMSSKLPKEYIGYKPISKDIEELPSISSKPLPQKS